MKKSLIALAALAAVSAASAQSTVTIYGRANLGLDSWQMTGATAGAAADVKARNRLIDNSSRIGFRINEDLGGGLRAFSIIETGMALDTASNLGQPGTANSGAGYLGTREAHVGIGNGQAEVRLGRQNVFWGNGKIEDVGANVIYGGVTSAYTAPSSGWTAGPAARLDNTTKLVLNQGLVGKMFAGSEIWYGIQQKGEQTAAGLEANAKAQGFTLKAEQGPFAAQLDYGQNKATNNGVGVTDSTVTGTKVGVAYFYAPTSKVTFINSSFKTAYTDAAVNNVAATTTTGFRKQGSNAFGVQHDLGGGNTVLAQYVIQADMKNFAGASVADTGSKAYAFGYRKDLSKRTSLSLVYQVMDNDKNNNIMNSGGGLAAVAAGPLGGKVKMVGAAVQHNF
ncbi:MAG: porin [Polaromonas sp.]|nr:porin [Polaromonas sp.]